MLQLVMAGAVVVGALAVAIVTALGGEAKGEDWARDEGEVGSLKLDIPTPLDG
jgi:SHS family lactate transporter-like MFS transporter